MHNLNQPGMDTAVCVTEVVVAVIVVVMAAVAHSASSLAQQWGPACHDCHRHPLLALTDLLLHMKLL